jgi:predicted HTH transcriptional regulator
MFYTPLLFGKNTLTDLKAEDLRRYFSEPKEESDKLEFKSFPLIAGKHDHSGEREKAVLRTICAFLNTEGGILIWGAPKMQKKVGGKGGSK